VRSFNPRCTIWYHGICGSKAKSRRFASCILTSWILTVEIPDLCVVGYVSPLHDRLRLFLIEVNSMPGVRNRNGNGNLQSLSSLPSLSRGIYKRVAERLGCDPSYVSRVARGERESRIVSDTLLAEIQRTWALVNKGRGKRPVTSD